VTKAGSAHLLQDIS